MAARTSTSDKGTKHTHDVEIVELQLTLNPRGRSVVHGTMLVDGHMRTIKRELSDSAKQSIGESILKALDNGG